MAAIPLDLFEEICRFCSASTLCRISRCNVVLLPIAQRHLYTYLHFIVHINHTNSERELAQLLSTSIHNLHLTRHVIVSGNLSNPLVPRLFQSLIGFGKLHTCTILTKLNIIHVIPSSILLDMVKISSLKRLRINVQSLDGHPPEVTGQMLYCSVLRDLEFDGGCPLTEAQTEHFYQMRNVHSRHLPPLDTVHAHYGYSDNQGGWSKCKAAFNLTYLQRVHVIVELRHLTYINRFELSLPFLEDVPSTLEELALTFHFVFHLSNFRFRPPPIPLSNAPFHVLQKFKNLKAFSIRVICSSPQNPVHQALDVVPCIISHLSPECPIKTIQLIIILLHRGPPQHDGEDDYLGIKDHPSFRAIREKFPQVTFNVHLRKSKRVDVVPFEIDGVNNFYMSDCCMNGVLPGF